MDKATRSPNIFVGIPVSPIVRHTLHQVTGTLKTVSPNCKWVHPEDYHLTLKFLGPVSPDLPELFDEVAEIVQQTALTCSPFTVTVSGLGTFDKRGKPFFLWAGINPLSKTLNRLHEDLETAFARGGRGDIDGVRAREHETYQPHITLARVNRTESARIDPKIIAELSGYDPVSMLVDGIAVMFNAGGEPPHYRIYKSFTFSAPTHGK